MLLLLCFYFFASEGTETNSLVHLQQNNRVKRERTVSSLFLYCFPPLPHPAAFLPDVSHTHGGLQATFLHPTFLHVSIDVPVGKGHQPPHDGEEQPAAEERHGKDDQGVAPFQVHQGSEDVLEEPSLLPDVLVRQVAGPALGDEAGLGQAVPDARFAQVLRGYARQHILLGDDALSGQHRPVTIASLCTCLRPASPSLETRPAGGKRRLKTFPPIFLTSSVLACRGVSIHSR